MSLASQTGPVRLVTFDGDVTLYDDGQSLIPGAPIVQDLLWLLKRNICVGIVTAAGYTDGRRYRDRLHGLLEAIRDDAELTDEQKRNLIVLGGESSYMFQYVGPLGTLGSRRDYHGNKQNSRKPDTNTTFRLDPIQSPTTFSPRSHASPGLWARCWPGPMPMSNHCLTLPNPPSATPSPP